MPRVGGSRPAESVALWPRLVRSSRSSGPAGEDACIRMARRASPSPLPAEGGGRVGRHPVILGEEGCQRRLNPPHLRHGSRCAQEDDEVLLVAGSSSRSRSWRNLSLSGSWLCSVITPGLFSFLFPPTPSAPFRTTLRATSWFVLRRVRRARGVRGKLAEGPRFDDTWQRFGEKNEFGSLLSSRVAATNPALGPDSAPLTCASLSLAPVCGACAGLRGTARCWRGGRPLVRDVSLLLHRRCAESCAPVLVSHLCIPVLLPELFKQRNT